MKRWFKASLRAGSFVTCAVGFLYARSETAANGHCHIEWYTAWLIVFFFECYALSHSTGRCVQLPFCLFCLIWEGFDGISYMLSDTVVCLGYFVALAICLQPKPWGSSQILIASTCGCVGWRVCILRHEDWVMVSLMEMVATNSVSLQAVPLVLLSSWY